jgi:16S rRNA (uracil1498-N3)-methyltransferase
MQIFYSGNVIEGIAFFSREETSHCLRVLRMSKGDTLVFSDGKGTLYEGAITSDDPSGMTVSVTSVISKASVRDYRLHVAISPLKNDDRLEWFIEKAVETGIDEITPVLCQRTEKRRIRRERLEGIILSAMKQSLRTFLPTLNEPTLFSEFVSGSYRSRKLIASCDETLNRKSITLAFSRGEDILILIGPEGDFTNEETRQAIGNDFLPVHLGPGRLRTETAGIAACCSVYLANI